MENGKKSLFRPLWRLGATYRLIEKLEGDFLLVIIERFAIGAVVEALRANID